MRCLLDCGGPVVARNSLFQQTVHPLPPPEAYRNLQAMMVSIRNLNHHYPARRHTPSRQALNQVNLSLEAGSFFVLTGPNGGGKSTLFRILCGLMCPSAGSVTIQGQDATNQPDAVRRLLGVVFQKPALDKYLTVLENLRIHQAMYGMKNRLFQQRLEEGLTWTGLKDRLNQRVDTLSGGLARQVELVKALLHQPAVLLMDEPTSGLDPGSRHAFLETVERIRRQQGITVLMTSHIFSEAERADQVGILHQGRLIACDRPSALKAALGREMLVIRSDNLDHLQEVLTNHPQPLRLQCHNDELRVEGGDITTLIPFLLENHRQGIRSLSLRQPTLLDVYIHHTAGQSDATPVANGPGPDTPAHASTTGAPRP